MAAPPAQPYNQDSESGKDSHLPGDPRVDVQGPEGACARAAGRRAEEGDGDDERAMDKKMKAAELTLLENIGNMLTKAPAAAAGGC